MPPICSKAVTGRTNCPGSAEATFWTAGPEPMLLGGAGADVFDFNSTQDSPSNARDTLQDFVSGTEHIDLRTIDANTALAGDQGFRSSAAAPSRVKSDAEFQQRVLSGDVNGDKVADFRINVPSVSTLAPTDFYLLTSPCEEIPAGDWIDLNRRRTVFGRNGPVPCSRLGTRMSRALRSASFRSGDLPTGNRHRAFPVG